MFRNFVTEIAVNIVVEELFLRSFVCLFVCLFVLVNIIGFDHYYFVGVVILNPCAG